MVSKRFEKLPSAYKHRPLEVIRRQQITPRMVRVTLGGAAMDEIKSMAPDDNIRIQIPEAFDDIPLPPVVEFQPFRLVYPENAPPGVIRALTVRALRPEQQELDIEIALHDVGILSRWAMQARHGQRVTVSGPGGSTLWDGMAERFYLLGDATALPAISRFVETLPSGTAATVVAEVEDAAEEQMWLHPAGTTLRTTWLHRNGQTAGQTTLIEDVIGDLPAPNASTVIFAAGESATMRRVRRRMAELWPHLSKDQQSISGYWKREDDEQPYFREGEEDGGEA